MAKQFRITTTQKFTKPGKVGVWMFLASPVLWAIGYVWLAGEMQRTYSSNPLLPAVLLILSGLAFMGGLVLLLIGREQHHVALEVEDQPAGQRGARPLWS